MKVQSVVRFYMQYLVVLVEQAEAGCLFHNHYSDNNNNLLLSHVVWSHWMQDRMQTPSAYETGSIMRDAIVGEYSTEPESESWLPPHPMTPPIFTIMVGSTAQAGYSTFLTEGFRPAEDRSGSSKG